ncbi:cysteine-rich CWC family protein [Tepidimonas sp.]|uniref:cysteine-rich CWC family protein n=1 Tax=Tepidimonas sp. TaxID=2002775 RepID=UPI002FE3F603
MCAAEPAPAPPAVDPGRCPLCGGANGCAMEHQRRSGVEQPPCWCTGVRFTAELLARVPAPARGQACVCERCATQRPAG